MSDAKSFGSIRKRSAILAIALATLVGVITTAPAEARYRRHHGGALALGIGSLIVGGILANQYRRHRYYDDGYYYRPTYGYYSYAPRRYVVRHRHHRHHHRHW
ncbi:MAG: hypothetical protein ABL904_08800 [Hyphomicrobiaceae bacterium]